MSKDIYTWRKEKALKTLLKAVGNVKARLADELEVSEQVVQGWFLRGQISKSGAIKVSEHSLLSKYISKEELRPDIKVW